MLVLGFDPGIASLGLALVDMSQRRPRVVRARAVHSPSGASTQERLASLFAQVDEFCAGFEVNLKATEDQTPGFVAASHTGRRNHKSDLTLIVAGRCGGVFPTAPGVIVAPSRVNALCGVPRSPRGLSHARRRAARKAAIRAWVMIACELSGDVKLSKDAVDAIPIAICGYRSHRQATLFARAR